MGPDQLPVELIDWGSVGVSDLAKIQQIKRMTGTSQKRSQEAVGKYLSLSRIALSLATAHIVLDSAGRLSPIAFFSMHL